jgi:hypothetical protein
MGDWWYFLFLMYYDLIMLPNIRATWTHRVDGWQVASTTWSILVRQMISTTCGRVPCPLEPYRTNTRIVTFQEKQDSSRMIPSNGRRYFTLSLGELRISINAATYERVPATSDAVRGSVGDSLSPRDGRSTHRQCATGADIPKKYRQANLAKQPSAVGVRARTSHADGGLRYRPPLAAPRELYRALYLHRRLAGDCCETRSGGRRWSSAGPPIHRRGRWRAWVAVSWLYTSECAGESASGDRSPTATGAVHLAT